MTFSVEPQELRDFGAWLDRMADYTQVAISYSGHTRVDDGGYGNLMLKVIPALDEINGASEALHRYLHDILDASATEVFATSRHFEDTDAATAAELDRVYPR